MGSAEDSFVLKWNDFHTSLAASFQEMRGDGDFLDATVAVDENHQLQAHKVVLSASSPYFKSMLKNNPAQHPVLVMPPEVNFVDLCSVFEFIYHGEVRVAAADLDSFMKLVSLLKVKGLTDSPPSGEEEKKEPKKMKKARKASFSSPPPAEAERAEDYYYNDPNQYEDGHKIHLKGLVCPMCKQMYQDVRSLKEHMYVSHNVDKDEPTQRSKANKKGQRSDDNEFVHCEFCDKQLKKKSLQAHKKRCHGLAGNAEEDPEVPMASTSRGPPKKGRPKRKLEEQPPPMDYYEQGDEYEQPLPQKAVAHVQPTTRPFKEDDHLPQQAAPPPPPPPATKMTPEKRRPPIGQSPGHPHPRQLQGQPRPKKPDLQSKLGLRFGDQISITASGDEGGFRRNVKRPPPPGMGQQPPQVPQVGPSPRPPQQKPRPKPENVRPQHIQPPPPPMPKEMAPLVKEEPEDYEDDEDLMGEEEEEEEEYYGDDPYYEDQHGMMEGSKPNLDGAYDEEDDVDSMATE